MKKTTTTFNDIQLIGKEPLKIKNYVNKYNYNFFFHFANYNFAD